jgi:histidyl-tRNA synthetase
MALSTQPYKGARDFYLAEKRLQKYMFSKWRECAERFGYEEYDAPILEPVEIYLAKTGDEIVNEQTYVFEDRGGRKVVVRPEMTPTVSRMVAGKRQELPYPLRWYSIPNLWRYERPQRGRLREHWQLNADLFGVASTDAELEMITLVDEIFKSFGAEPDMFEIRINHRGLVDFMLKDYLALSEESIHSTGKLIDKMHKMERPEFISKLDAVLTDKERENGATENLLRLLDIGSVSDLPDEFKNQGSYKELASVLESLKALGLHHARFDATLMRGFDYYTGIVFEVFDTDPANNRSMMGGGRYDALVGLFGVDPVPTVGFGWGDVTLANFLETHHLVPELKPETDVYVALAGDLFKEVQSVLKELRSKGLNVTVDMSGKKLGNQIKTADKLGVNLVLIIGGDEISSGQFKLKNLQSGQEKTVNLEDIAKLVKEG